MYNRYTVQGTFINIFVQYLYNFLYDCYLIGPQTPKACTILKGTVCIYPSYDHQRGNQLDQFLRDTSQILTGKNSVHSSSNRNQLGYSDF